MSPSLIDVNVNLSRWPLRRVFGDDTAELMAILRSHGVTQAWAGSFDGLLHKDIGGVNARLADECARFGKGILSPFGSINPMLPDWEEDLRRCAEDFRMRGVRLHPSYHGYAVTDPVFLQVVKAASERRLIVQLAVLMEDERMMHPIMRVEPLDISSLLTVVREIPEARLVLLNAMRSVPRKTIQELTSSANVYVEISTVEGIGGVGKLMEFAPPERLLFGSYAPLFYFESSLLKLKESPIDDRLLDLIRSGNAERLLQEMESPK